MSRREDHNSRGNRPPPFPARFHDVKRAVRQPSRSAGFDWGKQPRLASDCGESSNLVPDFAFPIVMAGGAGKIRSEAASGFVADPTLLSSGVV